MKKISRDERKGVFSFLIIVICVAAALAVVRSCSNQHRNDSDSSVTVIYSDPDSKSEDSPQGKYHKRSMSGRRKSGHKKSNSKKSTSPARPPRDFLEDTIPTILPMN